MHIYYYSQVEPITETERLDAVVNKFLDPENGLYYDDSLIQPSQREGLVDLVKGHHWYALRRYEMRLKRLIFLDNEKRALMHVKGYRDLGIKKVMVAFKIDGKDHRLLHPVVVRVFCQYGGEIPQTVFRLVPQNTPLTEDERSSILSKFSDLH